MKTIIFITFCIFNFHANSGHSIIPEPVSFITQERSLEIKGSIINNDTEIKELDHAIDQFKKYNKRIGFAEDYTKKINLTFKMINRHKIRKGIS